MLKKYTYYSLSILGILLLLAQPTEAQKALSNRVANYKMKVYLDTDEKMTRTQTDFLWRNPSADTIRDIQMHLYYNAFKNDQSTFMQESGATWVNDEMIENCDWGWSQVLEVKDAEGNQLTSNYIQPNGRGVASDQTVLRIALAKPVLPYDSVRLDINWQAKIPKLMIRTGHNREYYFMAQWFPKAGVYEYEGVRCAEQGHWNCNQYHRFGEYYSDFGVYEVELNVPENYVVGASGKQIAAANEANRKIVTYKADDVIDFTWTAYPNFVEANDKWADVDIRLLHHPDRQCVVERYMDAAKKCFEYMHEHVGAYPYSTLTIVDPPYHGIHSSGMEYPTLVTGAGFYCLPHDIRTTETITVHEMVHQYFMQMVASNEQEEAWMDEGFTAYFEGRIMDHYYKNIMENDWLGFQITNKSWRRYRYINMDDLGIAQPAQAAWDFVDGGYSPLTYGKTAVTLNTLEGLVGIETMDEIMKAYFEQWKFKHPCGQNFIDVVTSIVRKNHGDAFGETMDWFFEQTIYSKSYCDYAVKSIQNTKTRNPIGFISDFENCEQVEKNENPTYNSSVRVNRIGEMQLPVELVVRFENGTEERVLWDGKAKTKVFEFQNPSKLVAAVLDPDGKLDLDVNCVNNSRDTEISKAGIWKYTAGWMRWIQNIMQSANFLI